MKTHIKSNLLILILFSIGCFLPSCNKKDKLIWEGRVLEYGTNKPINNATLVLYRGSGEILGGVSFEAIDTLVTGANGEYKFKFLDGPYGYKIIAKAHLYYDKDESQNVISNGKTKKDLILDPHAWLRIHVKNVNPVDENDAMTLQNQGCSYKVFKGNNIDEYHICTTKGNRSEVLKYTVSKIGQGAGVKHEINYQSGSRDTTEILLEY